MRFHCGSALVPRDDVASAVLYLLRSDFVTGDVLCVTGGQHFAVNQRGTNTFGGPAQLHRNTRKSLNERHHPH